MKSCPECGSKKMEMVSNELMCKKCGLVIDEKFVSGSRLLL